LSDKGSHSGTQVDEKQDYPDRRSFLGVISGLLQAGVGLFLAIPIVKYVLYPAFESGSAEEMWSPVSKVSELKVAEPERKTFTLKENDGWAQRVAEKAVWAVLKTDGSPLVFTAVCPHLGCSINWTEESKSFNCPCHKSSFDVSGNLISGPAPRPMDSLETKIDGGVLQVKYENFKQLLPTKEVLS
jgi:menaquinol-cytochrome c reductase iron-sulfur subunit